MRFSFFIIIFVVSTLMTACSVWTLNAPHVDLTMLPASPSSTLSINVVWWGSQKIAEAEIAEPIQADVIKVSNKLLKRGIKSLEVEVSKSKNTKTSCGGCGLGAWLIPEFRSQTLEIIWYDTTDGNRKNIYSANTEWKITTWFFLFPYVIPVALKESFSDKYPNSTFIEKLRGTPMVYEELIKLNKSIVKTVYDGNEGNTLPE